MGETFDGFLPPQENVRIYHIRWHHALPESDETGIHSEVDSTSNETAFHIRDWQGDDVDHLPIPTAKTISPDFVPRVIAIYRDIMQLYQQSDYPQRNKIWHQVLSAMKLSLAEVRLTNAKQRRRRPPQDTYTDKAEEESEVKEDRRAIKRATRLALEGCTSKATKVLDRSFQRHSLTDQETIQKLRALHPEQTCKFKVPEDAPIIAAISPFELRSASKRLAKGVSPGPTGTTGSVIRLLVDDEPCCVSMCHMMGDLINGFLSRQVMKRLNRARLVAIAKPDGGVRPVAIGEIFGKLAGLILLQRYEKSLEPLFSPMQQGVFSQAGCERIVHKLRDRYLDGYTILSVDMKNAFNTPSRDEMAKSVFAFATLKPFQRFFAAEYSDPSDLLYFGSDGNLASIIPSSAGVRQGSALASLYFCVFCQPILETLAMEFPGVEINAYIDDLTLVSRDPIELEKIFFRLRDLLKVKQVTLAETKCVWFQGVSGNSIPSSLQDQGLKTESDAVKILGAHIGDNESVCERLIRQVNKHENGFRRLEKMGMNNISLLLLCKCVNVRLQYLMRVHEADNTDIATTKFDQKVEKVVESWVGPLTVDQKKIIRLPLRKGGFGLTACNPNRANAYAASRFSVLERLSSSSARTGTDMTATHNCIPKKTNLKIAPVDNETSSAIQHEKVWKELQLDPEIKPILQATSFKGNNDWLTSHVRYIPSHLFKLAVMPRLNAHHRSLPSNLLCPGCGIVLDDRTALTHIPGCAQCSGFNTTAKHNALVAFLQRLCHKAGLPCEKEPRAFSSWKCLQCGDIISPSNHVTHQKVCTGRRLCRSGPDLVIYWNNGEVYYDLTVIHELSQSNRSKKCIQLINDAIKKKHNTYVQTNIIREECFQCLPVLSGGSLHRNTQSLIHAIADAALLDRQGVEQEFKLLNITQLAKSCKPYISLKKNEERLRKSNTRIRPTYVQETICYDSF